MRKPYMRVPSVFAALLLILIDSSCPTVSALVAINRPSSVPPSLSEEQQQIVVKNLLSICTHIQNIDLYSAEWADACDYKEDQLVASRNVKRGEILSLYPIHAVGLIADNNKTADTIVYDANRDASYFSSSSSQLDSMNRLCTEVFDGRLFVDVNPNRPQLQGWLGHLARNSAAEAAAPLNCCIVPLSAPLCALVATSSITKGSILCCDENPSMEGIGDTVAEQYKLEIAELQSYVNMAYPPDDSTQPSKEELPEEASSASPRTTDVVDLKHPFHQVNRNYPGLSVLHTDPDILVVEDFLTHDECDRLIAAGQPHLVPCLTKNADTNVVEQDPSRTSTNTNIPRRQAPSIVSKLKDLVNFQDEEQLEILQLVRYQEGQQFRTHTDGFPGPITACGFKDSGRLVTVFCYLNDVAEGGGSTRFTELGVDIQPKKGMAVLHFPNTVGLEEDERTAHEGSKVVVNNEKWLLATWLWKDALSDQLYRDQNLPSLGEDVI